MVIKHKTKIELDLEPIGAPMVSVTVGDTTEKLILHSATTKTYHCDQPAGALDITVELLGKSDHDPDTAVIIRAVRVNDIGHDKLAWAGVYYPEYPQPWASTQTALAQSLPGQTYLGWNGTWRLTITIPAFVWIHRTLGLGWMFE
jgi:hypothetical protein